MLQILHCALEQQHYWEYRTSQSVTDPYSPAEWLSSSHMLRTDTSRNTDQGSWIRNRTMRTKRNSLLCCPLWLHLLSSYCLQIEREGWGNKRRRGAGLGTESPGPATLIPLLAPRKFSALLPGLSVLPFFSPYSLSLISKWFSLQKPNSGHFGFWGQRHPAWVPALLHTAALAELRPKESWGHCCPCQASIYHLSSLQKRACWHPWTSQVSTHWTEPMK